ncbi:DNA repair protein RecN (Recombination protein N) [Clostridium tetanomorphum]|uniref:DNA repair protein RecN n=1 Tax=Clostridium tetanomorphum TaxID=1553 RepID=UPI00044EDE52|nr:DNA repair protein RecN [Clostridium tetanomorphum]KAJ51469.1 DNA repair protein RecN [Clostridium tetanomorphum DSM 665]MBP1863890.1 DNA repair protein RecN (Recombination protein N) [Clostridium tetanomorphum]NRS84968.1 DNA repair protein RecN (Recombination protein N) [Clostridium tetanomorphum]SQB91510.1 DNA repair protein recN [Clostridium tetanomorphum]
MLLQLNIKNFALIEDLSISFENGFNVLSGETGAGKSILIDAINYVLGGKFNKDLIRTGTDKTFVEAIFTLQNEKSKEELIKQGIEYEDWIIISRETFQSGKSITKVNGRSILISQLKLITETLLDIHGQHENQNLLDSSKHILYLDYFGEKNILELLCCYKKYYEELKEIDKKIIELSGEDGEREKIIDFLKFQIDEINNANFKIGEEKELQENYDVLSNAEKISKVLNFSYQNLYNGDENTLSILDSIGTIVKELKSVQMHMCKIENISNSLEEIYYNIEENIEAIRKIKDETYYDEEELNSINSRLFQIASLKKKYAPDIKSILEYRDKITHQYEELINSGQIIEELNNKKKALLDKLKHKAMEIHNIRLSIGDMLEKKIKEELSYIGLEKSVFKISIELKEEFNENGLDKVQFLISTNPGEPLKPLEKIVSGGELSRIMLALKTVFVDKDKIPTVIFDEIDTGISGRIAQSVAEKMYSISGLHQVFCVTHLPQIACISDNHYQVSKKVLDNKTYTLIKKLSKQEKEAEIARMIGGTEVTELTIKNAQEMINMADEKKLQLLS